MRLINSNSHLNASPLQQYRIAPNAVELAYPFSLADYPEAVAFMNLNACDSADSVPVIRRNYTYNAWESNVSKRGWFKGYTGSVNTIDELFLWVVTHGKNDHGYRFP